MKEAQSIPDQSFNIILLGPPGAGKSTISEALGVRYSFVVIATGQRLRAEVQARSELGRTVERYLEQGDLAPDSLMDRVLRASLATLEAEQGSLLDGYPRTMRQALGLDAMLADFQRKLHAVIALEVNNDEVIRRLSGRRICEGAGDPFPVHIDDLSSILRCQERGGRLVQRDDDRPEVVQQRLSVYHDQTRPLLEFYQNNNMLYHINANSSPAEVARRAEAILQLITERSPEV